MRTRLPAIRHIARDLLSLVYPNVCVSCSRELIHGEEIICLLCRVELPETGYHHYADNPVAKKFWGRVHVRGATALYHFRKGGRVQHLLHQIKYHGRQEIATRLGHHYGLLLREETPYRETQVIVPVPLHRRKLHRRGFNQSEVLGRAMAESLGAEVRADVLARLTASGSQTKRARYERWENVNTVFRLMDPDAISHKRVLLVDDVITTGATAEACVAELQKAPGVAVSIAAMASPL